MFSFDDDGDVFEGFASLRTYWEYWINVSIKAHEYAHEKVSMNAMEPDLPRICGWSGKRLAQKLSYECDSEAYLDCWT